MIESGKRALTKLCAFNIFNSEPIYLTELSRRLRMLTPFSATPEILSKWLRANFDKQSLRKTVKLTDAHKEARVRAAQDFTHPEFYGTLVFSDERLWEFDFASGACTYVFVCRPGDLPHLARTASAS